MIEISVIIKMRKEGFVLYYPLQLPYILDSDFDEYVDYKEEIIPELSDFVICIWQMKPKTRIDKIVKDIVMVDGCTELVISYKSKNVNFAAPSLNKTAYAETTDTQGEYIGIKFKPGAFTQLTGHSVEILENNYLDLSEVDAGFNKKKLLGLTFDETKQLWLITC